MAITKQVVDLLRNELAERPLADREIRRVPKLGNMFITNHRLADDDENYYMLFEIKIDGVRHGLYRRALSGAS